MTTVISYIEKIREALHGLYPSEEIEQFVQILFHQCCHFNRAELILYKNNNLTDSQEQQLDLLLNRLRQMEPIQYILQEASFLEYTFHVAPGVLIPRPETEELVELIHKNHASEQPAILDIGTGSGCIAISLNKRIHNSDVTAFDISPEALQIAKRNNDTNQANVTFRQIDILTYSPDAQEKQFDIIVSNPPYVLDSEKESMHANVLQHEPHLALFVADEDPLLFYRTIAELGLTLLRPQGKLYFEINALFGQETHDMLSKLGYTDIRVIEDIFGKERMTQATRP